MTVEAEPEEREDKFPVWAENLAIVNAFLAVSTQWRIVATLGGIIFLGLDYAAALPAIGRRSRRGNRALFSDLRIMELEALPILNERGANGA